MGLDWIYVPFDVDPERVDVAVAAIRAMNMIGVNVTVPLKERVPAFLDVVDPAAARVGSVNTIHNVDGELRGYSTDGQGFLRSLGAVGWPEEGQTTYVIGAGGSARAIAFALAERGNRVLIANRTAGRADALVEAVNGAFAGAAAARPWGDAPVTDPVDIIINTTSLGMHPREADCPPVPDGLLKAGMRVYDLIYAPTETVLLRRARECGCETSNGLGMLVQQGALALSLWTGVAVDDLPVTVMESAARAV
jgi:shikimate dehydrogenase